PAIHNAAFKHLGIDYVYLAFRVEREKLREAINGVRALKIHGLNVTKPLKVDVVPLLDALDKSASEVGAVNTILNKEGKLIGYNTDGLGALEALREAGVDLHGIKAVILGAGGAARAIAVVCYSLESW
ncbi:MAG: shikimate dehydrogenase, partial [Candidatus Bathyarchaeia archaeon]